MFPFDSTGDVAAQTKAKLAAPQTNTPVQRLSKWAATPIGLQNNVKTPEQVLRPAVKTEAPQPPAPVGLRAAPASPDFSEMIKRGGGNPNAFHTEGSQLVSSRSPREIQSDIAAHPPITTAAGQALLKPAAPVASVPTVGVQGAPAAATAPATARPGVQADPRVAMTKNYNRLASGWMPSGPNSQTFFNAADASPEAFGAYHQALAAHANTLANYNQTDPGAQIGLLKGIAGDRDARSTYLSGRGVPAAEINSLPQPGVQVDPSTGQDVHQWVGAQAGKPLQDVLASMPYEQSPQVQAALQAHINKQYEDPRAWEAETSQAPGIDQYEYSGALPGLLSGPAKLAAYALDRTPAGFASERNFNPQVHGLMRRYGLKPPTHGTTSADAGIGNPY